MTKKSIFFTIVVLVSVVIMAYNFLFNDKWEKSNIELNTANITPHTLLYSKDTFTVQREWIEIIDNNSKIKLTAFVYYPVLSALQEDMENLPSIQWQKEHFESMRKKIGDSLAMKMIRAKVKLATNGKLIKEKLPLIIFGPGLGWLPTDYTLLLTSLASRGNIIVSVTGVPISKQVYFPNQTSETTEKVRADYRKMAEYFMITFADMVKKSNENKNDIYTLIDTNKVILAGHSISGAAGLIAAQANPRIKAIINLDGDVTDEFLEIRPMQPILYITTQPQRVDNPNVKTWDIDRSENRRDKAFENNRMNSIKSIRIKIPNMYHLDFLDIACYKDELSEVSKGKSFGKISFSKYLTIIIESIEDFIEGKENWKNLETIYGVCVQHK